MTKFQPENSNTQNFIGFEIIGINWWMIGKNERSFVFIIRLIGVFDDLNQAQYFRFANSHQVST